jgi:hypothetical protein
VLTLRAGQKPCWLCENKVGSKGAMRTVNIFATSLYQIDVTLIGRKLAGKSVDRCGFGIADNKLRNNSAVELSTNTHSLIRVVRIAAKCSF